MVIISNYSNKSVTDRNLRLCGRDSKLVPTIKNISDKQFVNWKGGAKKVSKVDVVKNKADPNKVGINKVVKSRTGENRARKSSLNVIIRSLEVVIKMDL